MKRNKNIDKRSDNNHFEDQVTESVRPVNMSQTSSVSELVSLIDVLMHSSESNNKRLSLISNEIRDIKDDIAKEISALRVETARIDEKFNTIIRDLEMSERLARMEEKYDLLLDDVYDDSNSLENLDDMHIDDEINEH